MHFTQDGCSSNQLMAELDKSGAGFLHDAPYQNGLASIATRQSRPGDNAVKVTKVDPVVSN